MLHELLGLKTEDIPRVLLHEIESKKLKFEKMPPLGTLARISYPRGVSFLELLDISASATLNRSPSGVLCQDSTGIIVYSSRSAARLLGYDYFPEEVREKGSLVGRQSINLVPERHKDSRNQAFDEVLRTGIPFEFYTQRLHQSGSEIDIAAQIFRYPIFPGRYCIAAIIEKR